MSAPKVERREIKFADWCAVATSRFGKDSMKWEFKCPRCGNVQTMNDFKGLVEDPSTVAYYSCLGRWKKGVGCDWTLGGLFRIHTLTVDRDGDKIPVFEFSGEPVGLGEGAAPEPSKDLTESPASRSTEAR